MERIKVTLDSAEYTALEKLSEQELRPIPDQVRAIVRERLQKDGLLSRQGVQCGPSAV